MAAAWWTQHSLLCCLWESEQLQLGQMNCNKQVLISTSQTAKSHDGISERKLLMFSTPHNLSLSALLRAWAVPCQRGTPLSTCSVSSGSYYTPPRHTETWLKTPHVSIVSCMLYCILKTYLVGCGISSVPMPQERLPAPSSALASLEVPSCESSAEMQ